MNKEHIKPCNCKTCIKARENTLKAQRDEIIEMLGKDGVGLKNGKKLTPSEIEDVIYAIKTMRIK